MTFFAEVSGVRIVDGRLTVPTWGAWHADVTLDKEVSLAEVLTLTIGDITGSCAAWRAAPYQGRTRARLIGGRARWGNTLAEKPYKLSAGVRLSLVLRDAAKEVGETVNVAADRVVGTHYTRIREPACRLLNRLAPSAWWIDMAGVTRIAPRETSAIVSPFSLVGFDGARGVATIATERPADFVPGRTFKSPLLASTITIGGVVHTISKTGLRTEVLAA